MGRPDLPAWRPTSRHAGPTGILRERIEGGTELCAGRATPRLRYAGGSGRRGAPTRAWAPVQAWSAARYSSAMSIFFIWSIAANARSARPRSASAVSSSSAVGTICQDSP